MAFKWAAGAGKFISEELPNLMTKDTIILANIAGSTAEECVEIARKLDDRPAL